MYFCSVWFMLLCFSPFLSTEWVDYVEEPMKYQALRPQFFSMGGWGGGLDGDGVVVLG